MKITFCGAARIVTGSCYLIEVKGTKIIVDCGMFQGRKETTKLNYLNFKFKPSDISYVLLTHAHIDHSGLLPKLWKEGFRGKILATSVTKDLCKIMLKDSAFIQSKDTEYENKRRKRQGLKQRTQLYTEQDAANTIPLFKQVDYNKTYPLTKNLRVVYNDAGHIIGSGIIELFVNENGVEKKLVFSGDLGQWDVPIINDPTLIKQADYVFLESTYGDRLHEGVGLRDDFLLKYAKETYKRGGRLLIPSFAIERTQELLYAFNKLIKKGGFPKEKIFLDSPLAIRATEIFKKHKEFFDYEALHEFNNPFNFPNLIYSLKTEDSIKLNTYDQPCIIVAGSGMCTGGRIRHHLKYGLEDPKNTVLFVGYQAYGTTGRYILEGAKRVKMMGRVLKVRAKIEKINSFSAHADYKELLRWMNGFQKPVKKVFLVHGEEKSCKALKQKLKTKNFNCYIPKLGEKVEI